jgi:hypothetical protein
MALLGLLAARAAGQGLDGERPGAWQESPWRSFGPFRSVAPSVLLRDEADDAALRQAISESLAGLSAELFARQGWRAPVSADDPLRIQETRKEAGGVRRLVARAVERRRLVQPSIEIDGSGLSDADIVAEARRLFALAVVSAYGVPEGNFLTAAAAELLAGGGAGWASEALRADAAAPLVDIPHRTRAMGRVLLEEFARAAGGPIAVRLVFERASERGEDPLASLGRLWSERTGQTEEALVRRFAALLYATVEPETGPSSIGLWDLQAGALDAAAPAAWQFRHHTYVPAEAAAPLKFTWPAGAGEGAAVVRYRDPELPPDVLFLSASATHTLSLSGVARVDWVVAGSAAGGAPAPVFFEPAEAYPYAGLVPHAVGSQDGVRIWWTTEAHENLAGWAVFREEVQADGSIARTGPQIVPASEAAMESFRYVHVDPDCRAGAYYRYTVWAVTGDGLLAKAFSATIRAPE